MFFRGIAGEVNPVQREILTIAYASTQHLLNMVNLLLDISRLEGGRMPLDRIPQTSSGLVRRAVSRMTIIAQSNSIAVEPSFADEAQMVYADGELVLRVLQNLLDNAIKFSPKGGRVEVAVTRYPPEALSSPQLVAAAGRASISVDTQRLVCFAVRDYGKGIRPQDLEKIFQKFGQAGDRRTSGSGLGLTFCKLVVEAHGGRIWVESALGEGSCFYFTLPAAEMTMGEAVTDGGIIR
jgi:signal transduction histidine kinase